MIWDWWNFEFAFAEFDQKHAGNVKQLSGFHKLWHKIILYKFVVAEIKKGSENWYLGLIFSGLALVFFGTSNEKLYPTPSYSKPFDSMRSGSLGDPINGELGASRVPSIKFDPVVLELRNLGKLFLGPSYIYWNCLWLKSEDVIRNKLKDSFHNVNTNCTNKKMGIMLMSPKI